MGTKMFYDSISSSMDYSNRMTGLMGYAPQTMCRHELWKGMKITTAASAPEGAKRCRRNRGQERHQEEPAGLYWNMS